MLDKSIHDLELSTRVRKCLEAASIFTVGELVQQTDVDLLSLKNFGLSSRNEVRDTLAKLGLSLSRVNRVRTTSLPIISTCEKKLLAALLDVLTAAWDHVLEAQERVDDDEFHFLRELSECVHRAEAERRHYLRLTFGINSQIESELEHDKECEANG